MYEKALQAAGLTDKQAQVYISCITHGPAKVPEIARRTKLKRTTTYGIVDELVADGFLVENFSGKRKLYGATDPDRLEALMAEKTALVSQSIPGLSDLFLTQHVQPKIASFTGTDGLRKIYTDALTCKGKEIRQMVDPAANAKAVGETFIKEYIADRAKKNIAAYDLHPVSGGVYTDTRGTKNASLKRQVRYLPPHIFHAAMLMIYDHKVAMISTKEENFGFIIESKEFANTLSAYFDFMWGLGSKTPDLD